jgi:hypothetical protein
MMNLKSIKLSKRLENIYIRGGLICVLANVSVNSGMDSPHWWLFVIVMNLLVNCKGNKDD